MCSKIKTSKLHGGYFSLSQQFELEVMKDGNDNTSDSDETTFAVHK